MNTHKHNIRTYFRQLLCVAASLIALTSCGSDDPAPAPVFSIDKSSITVDAMGGKQDVKVTTNENWTAQVTDSWVSLQPAQGTTNATVSATVQENNSITSRQTTISFNSKSGKKASVSVQQAGKTLSIDKDNLAFEAEGGAQVVKVTAVGNYEVSKTADWLTVSKEAGQLTVTAAESFLKEARQDVITLRMLGLTRDSLVCRIEVSQMGKDYHLSVTPEEISQSSAEAPQVLTLTTNDQWTATSSEKWIALAMSEGKGTQDLTLMIGENKTTEARKGQITIVGQNSGLEQVIAVEQAGKYLNIDKAEAIFGRDGGSDDIVIETDGKLTVTADQDWIKATIVDNKLHIEVPANELKDSRTGTITLAVEGLEKGTLSHKITVTQAKTVYAFSINVSSLKAGAGAEEQQFSISTNDVWTTESTVDWITLSPAEGSGNSTVVVSFADNTTTAARKGVIKVKGTKSGESREIAVSQPGKTLAVTPTSLSFTTEAASKNIEVKTEGTFEAKTTADWLTLVTAGNTVVVSVQSNVAAQAREAKVTISLTGLTSGTLTKTVTVKQEAKVYTFKTDHSEFTSTSAAVTKDLKLTTNDEWTATSNADWATVSAASGTGDVVLQIAAAENLTTTKRTATITITGTYSGLQKRVYFYQEGKFLNVTPTDLAFNCDKSSKAITVSTDATFEAKSSVDWITLTTSGNTINVEVADNVSSAKRTAKVTISATGLASGTLTKTVNISQDAKSYHLSADVTTIQATSASKSQDIKLTTNDEWTATSSADWLTLSATSGTGEATIKATLAENATPTDRNATITIKGTQSGKSVTIKATQAGKSLSLSQETLSFTFAAGESIVDVTTDGTYTASTTDSWITVSQSGNKVTVKVTENTTATARKGSVSVALTGLTSGTLTKTITVNQGNKSFNFAADVKTIEATSATKSQDIKLTTNDEWTATSSADWLTLSATSGMGDATIKATLAENTTASKRTATITLKGVNSGKSATVNVSQDGKSLSLSKESLTFDYQSGGEVIDVKTDGTYTASSSDSWLTFYQDGNKLTVNVAENTGTAARKGTVTVSMTGLTSGSLTKTITVNQSSKNFTFSTDITSIDATFAAKTQDIKLTTNDEWTATSSAAWLTLSATSGTGDATIKASLTENTTASKRTATITLKGKVSGKSVTINVSQDVKSFTFSTDITSIDATNAAKTQDIKLTTNDEWTATSSAAWLTLSATSGTGDATIKASLTENTTASKRTATITLKGKVSGKSVTINVNQAAKAADPSALQIINKEADKNKPALGQGRK